MQPMGEPIFILGMTPRSGTNFLWDLLLLHPRCGAARYPIREDFFLEHSDHLRAFIADVRKWWDPEWGEFEEGVADRLEESLGEGLVSFLWIDRSRRLVTKSPSVRNLDRFFSLFPRARLLILIRDGRSVVHSCMATFGWGFDTAAKRWATAADEIRRFDRRHKHLSSCYLIVRYEDLLVNLEESLRGILDFLDLDWKDFDFKAARSLPVRGSSFFYGPDHHSVHWNPVEREAGFDPRERWRSWSPQLHERFDWIAGDHLRHFGYETCGRPTVGVRRVVRHRLLDWQWGVATRTRSTMYLMRVKLGSASRPLRKRVGLIK
jgi:hypothetical protein